MYIEVKHICDKAQYFKEAKIIRIMQTEVKRSSSYIAVVTAGTSDIPVSEEAAITAETFGNEVKRIYDVGVAGIHRLFNRLDDIRGAKVVIVVAGMEGALASVIGGLVDKPVIAVPTSVGYGANFNGLSALLCMLNSCASGVTVVNIDNGFGAGYSASIINKLGDKDI
ncbi:Pyridinium-3,5-biscarboxylic acid mononucleotide synthase [bioreactor metagenome]|uniref:Pyridinium-3,5-biscarboxylic acid mononucleotide synthase n=2 Tax=root TaxID=1 RepID=A0A645GL88_9ZZZZ